MNELNSINPSINQSINQSNQPTNQSNNQFNHPSISVPSHLLLLLTFIIPSSSSLRVSSFAPFCALNLKTSKRHQTTIQHSLSFSLSLLVLFLLTLPQLPPAPQTGSSRPSPAPPPWSRTRALSPPHRSLSLSSNVFRKSFRA
jgi:hypothetical protein